jgi:hypothetical protein
VETARFAIIRATMKRAPELIVDEDD